MNDDGEPAFPNSVPDDKTGEWMSSPGMTLRDWFAGQALTGLVLLVGGSDKAQELSRDTAAVAYALADAMLAERTHNK